MHSIQAIPPAGTRSAARASSGSGSEFHSQRPTGRSLPERCRAFCAVFLVTALGLLTVALSGCGSIESNAAAFGALGASTGTLSFGNVTVGQSATNTVSLQNQSTVAVKISQITVTGQSFTLTSQNALPMTLAPGGSLPLNIQFRPTAAGSATGMLTAVSDAASGNVT